MAVRGKNWSLLLHHVIGVQSLTLAARSILRAWTSLLQSVVYKYMGWNRGALTCAQYII